MWRGLANASWIGRFGDLVERDPSGAVDRQVDRLRHVPGDRLALSIEVRGQVDVVGIAGRPTDRVDLLAPILDDHVVGGEVVVDVDAELALAGVLGQVADVPVRGEHTVAGPQVAFDRLRLRRRLDDHKIGSHVAAESSTGSLPRPHQAPPAPEPTVAGADASRPPVAAGSRGLDLLDPPEEVLVQLEVEIGIVAIARRGHQDRRSLVVDLAIGATSRAGRDLDEADDPVWEEECRIAVIDEDRASAVQRPYVGAQEAEVGRLRQTVQVAEQWLLAFDMQDGVADHGPMVRPRPRAVPCPMVTPTGGRSR